MYLNHLFYAADDKLWNIFRIGVTLTEQIDANVLKMALSQTANYFPYFSVRLIRHGEVLQIEQNNAPFVVSPNGQTVTLGTEESAYHLFAFAYEDCTLYMDASHFLTDGRRSVFIFLRKI